MTDDVSSAAKKRRVTVSRFKYTSPMREYLNTIYHMECNDESGCWIPTNEEIKRIAASFEGKFGVQIMPNSIRVYFQNIRQHGYNRERTSYLQHQRNVHEQSPPSYTPSLSPDLAVPDDQPHAAMPVLQLPQTPVPMFDTFHKQQISKFMSIVEFSCHMTPTASVSDQIQCVDVFRHYMHLLGAHGMVKHTLHTAVLADAVPKYNDPLSLFASWLNRAFIYVLLYASTLSSPLEFTLVKQNMIMPILNRMWLTVLEPCYIALLRTHPTPLPFLPANGEL